MQTADLRMNVAMAIAVLARAIVINSAGFDIVITREVGPVLLMATWVRFPVPAEHVPAEEGEVVTQRRRLEVGEEAEVEVGVVGLVSGNLFPVAVVTRGVVRVKTAISKKAAGGVRMRVGSALLVHVRRTVVLTRVAIVRGWGIPEIVGRDVRGRRGRCVPTQRRCVWERRLVRQADAALAFREQGAIRRQHRL